MSLATRIERLEEAADRERVVLPNLVINFIEVLHDENGKPYPGPVIGRRVSPGFGNSVPTPYGEPCWIDEAGNPTPPPDWTKKPRDGCVRT